MEKSTRPGQSHRVQWIIFLLLPIILATCLSIWYRMSNVRYTQVFSEDGVWDLTDFDFENENARIIGAVEYIPEALLSPEEFDMRAEEIQIGEPQHVAAYSTSRLRIILPEGATYQIAGNSIDFSERLYINGKWVADIGSPGPTKDTSIPDTAEISYMDEPIDGAIEIVRQSSNFVHRESGRHSDLRIGYPSVVRASYSHNITCVIMGCFLALALIHLALFCLLRNYRVNVYFAAFCFTWCLRTGLTGPKVFSSLLPGLSWYAKFRAEYIALPLTGALIILLINDLFPGLLHRAFRRAVYALSGAFALAFLFFDPYIMSWMMIGCYAYMAAAILYVALRFVVKLRRPNEEQWVSLMGIAIFLYAGLRDMFFYNDILFFPFVDSDLSQISMLVFAFFQMAAVSLSTFRQVEAAKAAEQRLTAENALLERMNRMRADLMANISHELKTPLAAMSALAQYTRMQLQADAVDEQTEGNLEDIAGEARRLDALVSQLLTLSLDKVSPVEMRPTDIGALIARARAVYEPLVNKRGNRLTLDVPEVLPRARCNGDAVLQVLLNLLGNANRHTDAGKITLSAAAKENHLAVTVADDGEGIAPDMLPYVFDREVSQGGTGIGLTLCKEMIEAQRGTIEIRSEMNRGTAVTFTLPLSEEEDA